jgi:hypothetical protein
MKSYGYRSGILVMAILLSVTYCKAQVDLSTSGGTRKQANKKERATEASALRVNETVSRLSALAVESQTFEPRLRTRIQTRAASLLWNFDRVFAHDLFLKAWEAAESADSDGDVKQQGGDSKRITNESREARRAVITAVWQKDPVLAEELFARLTKGDKDTRPDDEGANTASTSQLNELSSMDLERLNMARELLQTGDSSHAAKFAGNLVYRAVIPSLRFLSELRQKNAALADDLYVSLLVGIATDPTADANTVSLLSSYIFTPFVYVTIGSNGFPKIVYNSGETPVPDIAPRIRSMFLNLAGRVLLRPTPDPTEQRISFMVATRMLPLFEQFEPNVAKQIRARLAEVSVAIPSGFKDPELVNRLRKGVTNPDYRENVEQILDQAKQLTSESMKNRLYVRAAVLAAGQGDRSASQILQEITDEDLRDRVRAYVYMLLAKHALGKKDLEMALEFARTDALSPLERVWIYTQAVQLMRGKSPRKITDVIMEAVVVARRMDAADRNKARALTGVAVELMRNSSQIAKPYLMEALLATNNAPDFDSEDGTLETRLETPAGDWVILDEAPTFLLKNLFRELAKDDFLQALSLSEYLKGKEARSAATIAIAEVTLSSKNIPAP